MFGDNCTFQVKLWIHHCAMGRHSMWVIPCFIEECRMEDTEWRIRKVRCNVARLDGIRMDTEESAPAVEVVDFSWVLIHSCLSLMRSNDCPLPACCASQLNRAAIMVQHRYGSTSTLEFLLVHHTCFFFEELKRIQAICAKVENDYQRILLHGIAVIVSAHNLHETSDMATHVVFGRLQREVRSVLMKQLLDVLKSSRCLWIKVTKQN